MIGPMFYPMTDKMLHGMIGNSKYAGVVFTPELIKLLVLGRLKRAYERTLL